MVQSGPPPTHLQRALARRILTYAKDSGLVAGARLKEEELARLFEVSRTPVRRALALLESSGFAAASPHLGYALTVDARQVPADALEEPKESADEVYELIIEDLFQGRLADKATENQLVRRYSRTRTAVSEALARLAKEGLATRSSGYGWRFEDLLKSREANDESYRFRLIMEPAGILEPTFKIDPAIMAGLRRDHEKFLARASRLPARVNIFDMNAQFHEALARFSGNRFILQAITQMSHLRRLLEYKSYGSRERVLASCREHLEIMDALDMNDREKAAALMREHLDRAIKLRLAFGEGGEMGDLGKSPASREEAIFQNDA